MEIPNGTVDWNEQIASPSENFQSPEKTRSSFPTGLRATAHCVVNQQDTVIILDEPSRILSQSIQCMVIGTSKECQSEGEKWCYVILILSLSGKREKKYERIGVGRLRERESDWTHWVCPGCNHFMIV